MRPLRSVPQRLSHIHPAWRGDRVAAGPAGVDESGQRGTYTHHRPHSVPLGPVPSVPGLRSRLSVGGALRSDHGANQGPGSGPGDAVGQHEDHQPLVSQGGSPPSGAVAVRRPPAPGLPTLRFAVAGPAVRSAPVVAGSAGPFRVADSGPGRPLLWPVGPGPPGQRCPGG